MGKASEGSHSPTSLRQTHKRLDFETEVVRSFDAACVRDEAGLEMALTNLQRLSYDLEWEPNLGERFIEALLKFESESGGSQGVVEFVLLQSEFYRCSTCAIELTNLCFQCALTWMILRISSIDV